MLGNNKFKFPFAFLLLSMKLVEHHLHIRKMIYEQHQPYPHPNPTIRFLDKFVFGIAFIMPLTALPQLYKVWFEGNAQGVSVLTWLLLAILSIPMIIYGIVHKEKPIILMYALWVIVNSLVVIGAILA